MSHQASSLIIPILVVGEVGYFFDEFPFNFFKIPNPKQLFFSVFEGDASKVLVIKQIFISVPFDFGEPERGKGGALRR